MVGTVSIAIDAEIYAEFVVRRGKGIDVALTVENIVRDFLDRTRDDPDLWSAEYLNGLVSGGAGREDSDPLAGDPRRGYQWQTLFLPNGTQVRMTYRGASHHAEVRHERIEAEGETFSPSEWARRVAGGTNRNAWRDLWLRLPGEIDWRLADNLRRRHR